MNIYFLVEGKTESKVYPAWLSHLLPELKKVNFFEDVHSKNYKMVNAKGQPFYPEISNAIDEVKRVGKYHYLVICLDAEENSVDEVKEAIHSFLTKENVNLDDTKLILIIQNRCIETWFLGNQKIYVRNPQNPELIDYMQFYDVSKQDPERMGMYQGFESHAQFHKEYLKALFEEKKLKYSESFPRHTQDKSYLKQLQARVENSNRQHLATFQDFLNFCTNIRAELAS